MIRIPLILTERKLRVPIFQTPELGVQNILNFFGTAQNISFFPFLLTKTMFIEAQDTF